MATKIITIVPETIAFFSISMQPRLKSFAQTLKNSYIIPLSQLPKPCIKRFVLVIKILEDEYKICLVSYKNNLHGKVTVRTKLHLGVYKFSCF